MRIKLHGETVMAYVFSRVLSFCHRPDSKAFEQVLLGTAIDLFEQSVQSFCDLSWIFEFQHIPKTSGDCGKCFQFALIRPVVGTINEWIVSLILLQF